VGIFNNGKAKLYMGGKKPRAECIMLISPILSAIFVGIFTIDGSIYHIMTRRKIGG